MLAIFPVPCGVFAGMSQAQLLAARGSAQTALIALESGSKAQSVSYTQGDGAKSVSYTPANNAALRQLIRQLNQALGLGGRRAIKPYFA